MRYWVNVISKNHVEKGVAGGFTQADHGRDARLKRMSKGDGIVFYSPRVDIHAGKQVQAFTAIGQVDDDAPYQVDIAPEFQPWRRRVTFRPATEAPAKPLIESLDFIKNKATWGVAFRRGFFEVGESDFKKISAAMNVAD